MYKVIVGPAALDDLDVIIDHYIELELPREGLAKVRYLLSRGAELEVMPQRFGRLVISPNVYSPNARFIPANHYKIIFVVDDETKTVEINGYLPDKYAVRRLARRFG